MKLPQAAIDGAFTIGDRRFALFASFVLVPVEEDFDGDVGVIYRAAEVSSICSVPDAADPFVMETAHMTPQQLRAATLEAAALGLATELRILGKRIVAHQQAKAASTTPDGPDGASGNTCCAGHNCDPGPPGEPGPAGIDEDAAVEAAIDAGDPEALLAAVEGETPATNETP